MSEPDGVEVWVVRHGPTEWSVLGKHTGSTDILLTADGEREAKALGDRLAGVRFDLTLVSPLRRALRTAELAGVLTGATVEPLVREWDYGDAEGLTRGEFAARAGLAAWSPWFDEVPRGETLDQVCVRADRVVELLRGRGGGRVLIVAHGHFLRILAARWCGLPARTAQNLELDPARISVLGADRGTPTIRRWNG